MAHRKLLSLALGTTAAIALVGPACAGDYTDSGSYNSPFGMATSTENQAVNPSLRDANGNLTLVNGQFTSSPIAQGFSQSNANANSFAGGVANASVGAGSTGSGASFAGATAIANSLNVVTVGNNNTVVVNSVQTNNGNVTATVNTNGQH